MGATDSAIPVPDIVGVPSAWRLTFEVVPRGDTCLIRPIGELDLGTRDQFAAASTAGDHAFTVIDLAGVTFMDCTGYGSLMDSRLVVQGQGRMFTTMGQTGQPARLFELIAALDAIDAADK